jgi:hypothetical protein
MNAVLLLGWVPPLAPCAKQWQPAALQMLGGPSSSTSVAVDISQGTLKGRTPIAIRLGWPLGMGHIKSDICNPTSAVQAGYGGAHIPGSCPLYSATSNLPANPFYATIISGKCQCLKPQTCDE